MTSGGSPEMAAELKRLSDAFESQQPQDVLKEAIKRYAPKIVLACSFGAEDVVLVDIDPATFNIDPEGVDRALTPRTKAIVPVHLYGLCAPMDRIMDVARRRGLKVLEEQDAAGSVAADPFASDAESKPTVGGGKPKLQIVK